MNLFVISLVQWQKLYYIYFFFTQRTTDFDKLKRNMNDRKILFLMSFASLFFLVQDHFMFCYS